MRDLGNAPRLDCVYRRPAAAIHWFNMTTTKKMESTAPRSISPFRASRIYAEGWNAARRSSAASPNPYKNEPEQARWLEGYTKGRA